MKKAPSWLHAKSNQSCPTLCNPMDCSLPGSSIHGILQARILECVAIVFSRGSSQARDRTWVSFTAGRFFTIWATGKPLYVIYIYFFMIIKNVSEGWINHWVFASQSGVAAWNAVSYYSCLCHEDIPDASRISVANTHRLKPSFQPFVCMCSHRYIDIRGYIYIVLVYPINILWDWYVGVGHRILLHLSNEKIMGHWEMAFKNGCQIWLERNRELMKLD